jgi:hypothetical protein
MAVRQFGGREYGGQHSPQFDNVELDIKTQHSEHGCQMLYFHTKKIVTFLAALGWEI